MFRTQAKAKRWTILFALSLFVFQGMGQNSSDPRLTEMMFRVRDASYGDSATLFQTGKQVIEAAQALKSPAYEAEVLIYYGNYYVFQNQLNEAKSFYGQAFEVAKGGGVDSMINRVRIRYAFIHSSTGEKEKAYGEFSELLHQSAEDKDTSSMVESMNGMAMILSDGGKKDEALAWYQQALRLAKISHREYQYAFLLNNIGLLHWEADDQTLALKVFDEALQITNRIRDARLANHLSLNMGLLYLQRGHLDSATVYFHLGLSDAQVRRFPEEVTFTFNNLGQVELLQGHYSAALAYYDSAAAMGQEHGLFHTYPKPLLGRSNVYLAQGKYEEAKFWADSALKISRQFNSLGDITLSYGLLYQICDSLGDYKNAYRFHLNFKEFQDSLTFLAERTKYNELKVQYEVEQSEKNLIEEKRKVDILQKEQEVADTRFYALIVIFGSFILIGILVFFILYFRRLRKEQERFSHKLLESQEIERSRIARDLHDGIGPMLSMIRNKLYGLGHEGGNSYAQLSEDFSELMAQTRAISHQLFPAYLGKIGLSGALKDLLQKVEEDTGHLCTLDIHELDESISLETKTHLFRIVQELVNNTLKHAEASSIRLSIHQTSSGIAMTYQDNGVGVAKGEKDEGMGMMSIQERVKILNGKSKILPTDGGGFTMSFEFHPQK